MTDMIPGIEAKQIPGFRGVEVLREDPDREVEFSTAMTFDSLDSVVAFQGPDYARACVPDRSSAVLSRWDDTSRHYQIRATRPQG